MEHPGRPKMGRSWRRVALAIAGLILAVSGRESRAGGCHVPERPALSRSTSWDDWATTAPAAFAEPETPRAPAALRTPPCGGETPSRSGHDAPPAPPALEADALVAPAPSPDPRLRPGDAPASPRPAPAPLDRPPRAA